MTIGDIDLGVRPVLLAPMEDVTDASFRGICREQGADMTYTEFIPAEGLIRDARKAYAKLKTSDGEAPSESRSTEATRTRWSRPPKWRTTPGRNCRRTRL